MTITYTPPPFVERFQYKNCVQINDPVTRKRVYRTPDGLIALKNAVDPAGDVISDVLDDGTVLLKTNAENPNKDKAQPAPGASPAVDAMASKNAKTVTK